MDALTEIWQDADKKPTKRTVRTTPRRRGADAYDSLLWRLLARFDDGIEEDSRRGGVFGVTSAQRGAGVSTVAANLAIRAADHRMRPALLIEASPAKPGVARAFSMREGLGLADALAGRCPLSKAIHSSNVEGLDVMPLGTRGLIDRVGLDQQMIHEMVDGLRESHDFVIFDLPDASRLGQFLLMARRLDGALLAVRSAKTRSAALRRAVEQLRGDGVNLVGSVVCRQRQYLPGWLQRRL